MVHRSFTDSAGVVWHVTESRPGRLAHEGRTGELPRYAGGPSPAGGWLTFRSAEQRRVYSPIPEGWATATEADLVAWCARASRVGGRRPGKSPRRPSADPDEPGEGES